VKILDPQQAIVFDGLNMFGENEYAGNFFTLETIAEGMDWGAPEPDVSWLENVLRDGAIAAVQGHKNREVYLKVKVSAADGVALAAGETALVRAAGKRTTLTWTPPDGWAPTSVFDVEASKLEPETNDLDELRLERVYGLRFWCLPFTRSMEETTVVDDSAPGAEATTVLNDCSSLTGWTCNKQGPVIESGRVKTWLTQSTTGWKTLWLEQASVNMTDASKPYLRVDWSTTLPADNTGFVYRPPSLVMIVDGVTYDPVAVDGSYAWFKIDTPATITARFQSSGNKTLVGSVTYELKINELLATNTGGRAYPNIKQTSLPIGGAARTPALIEVSHDTTGLGDVLLYTWPLTGGYQPILHPYRTGGGSRTNSAECVSGAREPLQDGPTYTIPAVYLPRGSFLLVARMRTTGAPGRRTVTWTAETSATGVDTSGTCYVSFQTTDEYEFVVIDRILLPPTRVVDGSARNVILTLDSPDTNVQLDVALACHDDGALSIVRAGGNKTVSAIPPSVADPTDWLATEDVMAADVVAWGRHLTEPPQLVATVITTNVAQPVISATYFKRWLTHAME
jgi:hypothetical protein